MSAFRSKWLPTLGNDTDETDKGASVSSGSALHARLGEEITDAPAHGIAFQDVVDINLDMGEETDSAKTQGNCTDETDKSSDWVIVNAKPTHAVPTGCLGPIVCGVVGICGRRSCMTDEEAGRMHLALIDVRSPRNPHRVPNAWLVRSSKEVS